MHRRGFLQTGARAAVAGAAASVCAGAGSAASEAGPLRTSAILASYTAADHRRRLENIGLGQRSIRTCMRKHLVTDYLPASVATTSASTPAASLGTRTSGTSRNWIGSAGMGSS